jgi:flavin reductase (DIM6/NTAB) family NADH-FMN oxidoreductase RutF
MVNAKQTITSGKREKHMTALDQGLERPSIDLRAFRSALGQFATGVAIVTARDSAGQPVGLTINSFASVSLEPPLILWSVGLDSDSAPVFQAGGPFAVSILSAHQEAQARRFSSSGVDRFADAATHTAVTGAPIISGGVAWFDCVTQAIHRAGDHDIIVGRVLAFEAAGGPVLGFHRGRFFAQD